MTEPKDYEWWEWRLDHALGDERRIRLQRAAARADLEPHEFLRRLVDRALKAAPKAKKPDLFETPAFKAFWDAYPWKAGKAEALKAWHEVVLGREVAGHFARILDSLEKHKRSRAWQEDGGKYIPRASTWLRQRRWEDEVRLVDKPGNGAARGPSLEERKVAARRQITTAGYSHHFTMFKRLEEAPTHEALSALLDEWGIG